MPDRDSGVSSVFKWVFWVCFCNLYSMTFMENRHEESVEAQTALKHVLICCALFFLVKGYELNVVLLREPRHTCIISRLAVSRTSVINKNPPPPHTGLRVLKVKKKRNMIFVLLLFENIFRLANPQFNAGPLPTLPLRNRSSLADSTFFSSSDLLGDDQFNMFDIAQFVIN